MKNNLIKTKKINYKKSLIILSIIILLLSIIVSSYYVLDAYFNPDEYGLSNLGFLVPFVVIPFSIFIIYCLWILYFIVLLFKDIILKMKNKTKIS